MRRPKQLYHKHATLDVLFLWGLGDSAEIAHSRTSIQYLWLLSLPREVTIRKKKFSDTDLCSIYLVCTHYLAIVLPQSFQPRSPKMFMLAGNIMSRAKKLQGKCFLLELKIFLKVIQGVFYTRHNLFSLYDTLSCCFTTRVLSFYGVC